MKLRQWLSLAILAVLAFFLGVFAQSLSAQALGEAAVTMLGFMVVFLPIDLAYYWFMRSNDDA